jgi:hypothetical protein
MRIVINLILATIVLGLIWVLINSIQEPIAFKAERERRERAVIDKLMMIRQAQEAFRDIKGGFAPTFDSLKNVLRNDKFTIIQVIGDPDDPNYTGTISYDTTYIPAFDSIIKIGIRLDSIEFVPFGEGAVFDIAADTLTYQSTLVNVVEVGTRRQTFMGRFADSRYARYDQSYNPGSIIKFGDMNKPNLSGNWER